MAFGIINSYNKKIFEKEFNENKLLQKYLKENGFVFEKLLAYGKTSWIVIVRKNKELFTLKLVKKNTTRKNMVEREAKYLKLANNIGIGQKLLHYDLDAGFLMWKYIDALPLKKWIISATKQEIKKCVLECLKQAYLLDEIGLDHGQLAGSGTNIIVKKDAIPLIVDFEKASMNRKPHNFYVLYNFLFKKRGTISEKVLNAINDTSS